MPIPFEQIGRLPVPEDNAAIAIRTLDAGTPIAYGDTIFTLSDTVMQGHRFAVQPILAGTHLLSWGQPFGVALVDIAPGTYVCNEAMLRELRQRTLNFTLPAHPNFSDQIAPFVFDEARFQAAPPLPRYEQPATFMGYPRSGGRGIGTRNMIVLLGTSALTSGFVRMLETRLKSLHQQYPHIDGIVAVAHTEGGHEQPNNRALLLRTLAGFMVHPNVGAVLAVDYGNEPVNNAALQAYLTEHEYPLEHLPHQFMSLSTSFQHALDNAVQIVTGWVEQVNAMQRETVPLSGLKIGMQCGGSDAFSGVSANPLLGWVVKEVVQHGGSGNLAETDELIGAEVYTLDKVRDVSVAHKFVAFLERFKTWAGWHGHSAEGNPSGGNLYRGLYNIYLKSLGAATKRHPDVRLDAVIDYGEPMREPGFYFMDSPGNDLESVAGQVASGCNIIVFTTGNGSITNFPFVPTIKMVTTTERFTLLSNEMDVNAGAYLDGTPMDEVGCAAFDLTLAIASGQLSAGERAVHTQVQIWRDWRLTGQVDLKQFAPVQVTGEPVAIDTDAAVPDMRFPAYRTARGVTTERVGLILPTSLCSGQIARMAANQLNEQVADGEHRTRFVTLVHTEGCGAANGVELTDIMVGYLTHPLMENCLLLEHGCEKTHNSYFRHVMLEHDLDPQQFGWASIQLDGGIQNVTHKMQAWFEQRRTETHTPEQVEVGLEAVRLGLATQGNITDELAQQAANLTKIIVAAGGCVVMPEHDALLENPLYLQTLGLTEKPAPTLYFAQPLRQKGLHIMANPARLWSEILTGLGATGIEIVLALINDQPVMGHPLVPVLQVTANPDQAYAEDMDAVLSGTAAAWTQHLLNLLVDTLGHRYTPRLVATDNTSFQITRGLLGISL